MPARAGVAAVSTNDIDRAILRICTSVQGPDEESLLAAFATSERPEVAERIAVLVEAGKLRREGDRLWRVA